MDSQLELTGFTFKNAFDLGEYGARTCMKCGRDIRYAIVLESPNKVARVVVGPECAAELQGTSTNDEARILRYLEIEKQRPALVEKELPSGFLIPPVPSLNPMMAPVCPRLRFSIMTNIRPEPIHVTHCWTACAGDGCILCSKGDHATAKVYPVCVWKLTGRGTLFVPDNFPFGCTSFRGLALRDVDIAVMEELTKGRDITNYEWRIIRRRAGRTRTHSIQRIATNGLSFAASYVENVSLAFTEPVEGISIRKWSSKILLTSTTFADVAAEDAQTLGGVLEKSK